MKFKTIARAAAVAIFSISATFGFAAAVLAYTPSLTLTGNSNGNVLLAVQGDPNSTVSLSSQANGGQWVTVVNFGQTNSSGYFATNIYAGNSYATLSYYVVVNGQQSTTQTINGNGNCTTNCGCYNNCGGALTFSSTNPVLTVNQGLNVTVTSVYSGNSLYISQNTNSSIVSVSISGNTLNLYGLASGSSNITVCQNGTSQCGTLFVTVSGNSYNNGGITFSTTNPTLAISQSMSVTLYSSGGYNASHNNFYVSQNSNSSAVSATISGATLNLFGQNTGSSTVTVCQNGSSQCGTLFVTVNGSSNNNNGVTFSTVSPSLSVGQNTSVTIYSNGFYYTSYYYVSQNTNSAAVSTSVSGSTLNLYGQNPGTTNITVCQNGTNSCGSLFVTVGGSVLGATNYANGSLIKEGNTVYIVYKNTKTGFANAAAFSGLGFNWSNVVSVSSDPGLSLSGYVISSASRAHPWGSWVKWGNTVYFVDAGGLIPIADYQTFLSNGGQDRLVVGINAYDLNMPIESVMVTGDLRLR